MQNLVNTYINYCKIYLKTNSIIDEKKNLKDFVTFCDKFEIKDLKLVNFDIFLKFMHYLKENTFNSNYTINKKLNCVNRLLKFNKIPSVEFKKLKVEKSRQDILTETELKNIIETIAEYDFHEEDYFNLLDRVVINLLIDTGARVSEVCNINYFNLDLKRNRVLITNTKNHQDRYLYFSELTHDLIEELLKYEVYEDYLFMNIRTDKPIDRFYVRRIIDKIIDYTGIKFHVHTLRHSFATLMISKGCPLTSLKEMMGHSNIQTTMLYLHLTDDVIQKDYKKFALR